jgi:hypothetical protein
MLAVDSPLVAGVQAPATARTETVRVVRPFFIGETRHDREEILSLDWRLVQELVTAQKVVRADESEAAPARPVEPRAPTQRQLKDAKKAAEGEAKE